MLPRALYYSTQESITRAFFRPSNLHIYSNARDCLSDWPRRAAAGGGMLSAAGFLTLYFILYIMLDVIGTCMQNFKKIDLKKNRLFSFKAVVHCFCCILYTLQVNN